MTTALHTPPPCGSGFPGGFSAFKERQLVFLLVRQLVEAQFVKGDRDRSERLWQEAAALEIDPERITALLYGVSDLDDGAAMEAIDRQHRPAVQRRGWGWLSGVGAPGGLTAPVRGAWRRSAPRAASPARPAVR